MNVDFLLAEELRPDVNGKLTVLGLFPGGIVIFLKGGRPENIPPNTAPGLEKLCIIGLIHGVAQDKVYKFKAQLFTPSGEPYAPEINLGEARIQPGTTHTVLVQLKPFVANQLGHYNFHLFVDEELFSFPMEFREQA